MRLKPLCIMRLVFYRYRKSPTNFSDEAIFVFIALAFMDGH